MTAPDSPTTPDLATLHEIEQRVLWLAVRMIDEANRGETEIKVGGHQASCASLIRRRDFGDLQSYPSRTKDPDVADFSTGSVGLGAVAPLFSAAARRFVDAHHGALPPARFIARSGTPCVPP